MKKTTTGKKIGAFVVGWIGSSMMWYVFGLIGWTHTDTTVVGTLFSIFAAIFVWVKLYRYFVEQWAK